MLDVERPEIVHINTPPTARRELLEHCEAAGVAGIVLEKPLGVDLPDLAWLTRFAESTSMKVVVNHQLEYHPSRRRLFDLIADGAIGKIGVLDASARHTVAYQGTHVLQSIFSLTRRDPGFVFAQVAGAVSLTDDGRGHRSPDSCMATIDFGKAATALFRCGDVAPEVVASRTLERHEHKRIAVWGDNGVAEWTMWGSRVAGGRVAFQSGHDYALEDEIGQAALVDALCSWVTADGPIPVVSLGQSMSEFATILAIYTSAAQRRPVKLEELGEVPSWSVLDALATELRHAR